MRNVICRREGCGVSGDRAIGLGGCRRTTTGDVSGYRRASPRGHTLRSRHLRGLLSRANWPMGRLCESHDPSACDGGSQMSGSPALSGRTSGSASAEERRPTATGALAALLRLIPIPATRDLSVVLVLLLFSEFALELAGRDTHPLNHQVLPCGPSNIVLLQTRAGQGTNAPSVRRTERDLLGLRLLYPAPWGARGVRRCLRGVSPCRPAPSCSTSSG